KTLFVLGAGAWDLNRVPGQDVKEIQKFLFEGGRIVFSLQSMTTRNWNARREEKRDELEARKKAGEEEKKIRKPNNKKRPLLSKEENEPVSLLKDWMLGFSFEELESDEEGVAEPKTVQRAPEIDALPSTLSWHTSLYFEVLTNSWRTIYSLNSTNAAVIERSFGKGSVVLASDSYLFSNEAMRKERHAELLAWLLGGNREIIFDETHLGVQADPGIAVLARKYRLHGLVAGLLLLAGLFVWKNSISFVPAAADDLFEGRSAVVSGKDSAAGFVNLLRRSISPDEILPTCLSEWKKSRAGRGHDGADKLEKLESLLLQQTSLPKRERNPVESYRSIATELAERKLKK
ncbi:MAG: DUF4350 domain-containing protein, partial [Verrucomicrobiota bacterium]